MSEKIGILTFHYSNNYGAVLQSLSLQRVIENMGFSVEIINFVPSNYKPTMIIDKLGLRKNIFRNNLSAFNIIKQYKKIKIMKAYSAKITDNFNEFRMQEVKLSRQVNEKTLKSILKDYDTIIVGSDQVWNPSQRKRPEYFLNFNDKFEGKKISYAADSTTKEIDNYNIITLKESIEDFDYISVRNVHSFEFVKAITNRHPVIVADPTLLYDFDDFTLDKEKPEDYILAYILGKEIKGSHKKALEKIKKVYGDLPVYSIKIPTMNFEFSEFADRTFYDLNPTEWLNMIKNAKFVYTDSFHGVLFSIKYNKPFLAYYTEVLRATRFVDLRERYNIEKYIVENIEEIDEKKSIDVFPDYLKTKSLIEEHREYSLKFLNKALMKL